MNPAQLNIIQLGDITPSKTAVNDIARHVIRSVSDGDLAPIDTAIHLNAVKQAVEAILDGIRHEVLRALSLHPGSKADKWGCKIEEAEVGHKWNFSVCGDPVYDRLVKELEERKKFLKAIPSTGLEIRHEDELITLNQPVLTSTTSFKTTLAK
jgi:hypothetical protein